MADSATHLLWVDLETTGLDPAQDNIIEVGAILSDIHLDPLMTYTSVVRPDAYAKFRMMENDIVRTMHEESGLITLIDHGEYISQADEALAEHVRSHAASDAKILLAGSGVGHHDKSFMLRWMPLTYELLQYPVIDIGVIRRFLRDVVGAAHVIPDDGDSATKAHRAIADVEQHFREGAYYMRILKEVEFLPIMRRIKDAADALAGLVDS